MISVDPAPLAHLDSLELLALKARRVNKAAKDLLAPPDSLDPKVRPETEVCPDFLDLLALLALADCEDLLYETFSINSFARSF